ncbi:predicted protein [Nematostella vectensis]|uniref:F5/8 type C domain-containing protein n=1 Tax=Nematostella vectensis TaxID=45351 RepID=A7SYG8_NEMVE|nr:predicted protein [Nematostella vectensis]|eukprot:XP_001623351.1 predicted protein [Nematostella vectensis]
MAAYNHEEMPDGPESELIEPLKRALFFIKDFGTRISFFFLDKHHDININIRTLKRLLNDCHQEFDEQFFKEVIRREIANGPDRLNGYRTLWHILRVSIYQNDAPTGINLPGVDGKVRIYENSQPGVFISIIDLLDEDQDMPVCNLTKDAGARHHIVIFTDVNDRPTDITLSNSEVHKNEANVIVATIMVTDQDIRQSHRCIVCDLTSDGSCDESVDFNIDDSLRLKTSRQLDLSLTHTRRIKINCTDEVVSPDNPFSFQKAFVLAVVDCMRVISENSSILVSSGLVHDFGWSASLNNKQQWLQFDLGDIYVLTGIGCAPLGNDIANARGMVMAYKVTHTIDGVLWRPVLHKHGQIRLFQGNSPNVKYMHRLAVRPSFLVRTVRVIPQRWHLGIHIRAELYGCYAVITKITKKNLPRPRALFENEQTRQARNR